LLNKLVTDCPPNSDPVPVPVPVLGFGLLNIFINIGPIKNIIITASIIQYKNFIRSNPSSVGGLVEELPAGGLVEELPVVDIL
jgi:hypothetical protein